MDLKLKNKKVLVLASSKGIGREIANKYAEEGASVIITGRTKEILKKTADEISTQTGSEVIPFVTDVSKKEDINRLFTFVKEHFGVLDVLVSNAGGPPIIDFETSDEADWYDAFELTLMSSVRAIKEAIPLMKKNGQGRILYVASTSIKEPISELLLSNIFRSGVQALCKSLAEDYAKDQILINIVGPGRINTDRLKNIDKRNAERHQVPLEDWQNRVQETIPIGRYGTPEEFAEAAVFLGSYRNTYITGQTLLIDGGAVKAY
ncbi:SDR family oxidoreductase [Oceanobacillus jeddahense]|uniref:SDR family oxidoreductase n=1 Tax=Oceanobacillus jeddahense TaxID=1462527 RepID=A0ABY5JPZ3_9BACI|nr:SDR family oxidoreductase [Oceanobacillus jeddahense]UUI02372.1 SDR family oxidoreductase [Oceanobacillus jeddahense]